MDDIRASFLHPPEEFTPVPFWFWNDELDREEILRQLRDFQRKGVNGVVIHPRLGLPRSLPYLSDAFMEHVLAAVQEAERLGMTVVLYDEGMYPSGAANGLVVRNHPEYASRGLEMRETPCAGGEEAEVALALQPGESVVSVQAIRRTGENQIDPSRTVLLAADGDTVRFRAPDDGPWSVAVFVETWSMGHIRGIHYGQDDGDEEAPRSADLLNPEAVQSFISLTHERYYEWLKPYFGKTVAAMFTDEPDILGRGHRRGLQPWTGGFLAEVSAGGLAETDLPLLWFGSRAGESQAVRYKFSMAVRKRMSRVYYKPLHDWCGERGIALTGHPAESDDIALLEYFHIPGQDVVWRFIAPGDDSGLSGAHSTLGKCSSDAARHLGRRRNLNECFGVCSKRKGWDLTADEMKWYLNWLLVRGVNLIVPHAFYYSIRDDRRNERPPDVGAHNIWWDHYRLFADYIKRMSWLMTDSRNAARIAVLSRGDSLPWQSVKPLYEHQIEFNYLEEKLLHTACELCDDGTLAINGYRYTMVLMEEGAHCAPETRNLLQQVNRLGGVVIELADKGGPACRFGQLTAESPDEVLELVRRASAGCHPELTPDGPDLRISHILKDGLHVYAVVNEGEADYAGEIWVRDRGRAEIWHPWTGEMAEAAVHGDGGGLTARIRVRRRECIWLVVDERQPVPERMIPNQSETPSVKILDLSTGWKVSVGGSVRTCETLSSWTDWQGMADFSGTLVYEKTFELEPGEWERVELDLGEAHEMAAVSLNGHSAGVAMWRPYLFRTGDYLKVGLNHLRIEVTNSLANAYDQAVLPSGLIGPVELRGCKCGRP